jgi:hypothetical protein
LESQFFLRQSRNSPQRVETECSLPCSQEPYFKLSQINPVHNLLSGLLISILNEPPVYVFVFHGFSCSQVFLKHSFGHLCMNVTYVCRLSYLSSLLQQHLTSENYEASGYECSPSSYHFLCLPSCIFSIISQTPVFGGATSYST